MNRHLVKHAKLRTRILIALVLVALAVLLITGMTTVLLARRTAEDLELRDLRRKATPIARGLEQLAGEGTGTSARGSAARFPRLLLGSLRVATGTIVRIAPTGEVIQGLDAIYGPSRPSPTEAPAAESLLRLPEGIDAGDLDTISLLGGQQDGGAVGDLAFVAQPLNSDSDTLATSGQLVLVMTSQIDRSAIGRAGPFFLFAASSSLLAALGLSYIVARRLTRPLAAMQSVTDRIAAGDLTARVNVEPSQPEELATLGHTINAMATQLDEARALERNFLLSVSHDLRTPLTSIRGYSEAIADGTAGDPSARHRAAEIIRTESIRLERLVADLLDLARLGSYEFSLHPRIFDIGAVVANSAEAFRPAADDLNIALTVATAPMTQTVGDPERVGQIIANLMENALKYATSAITVTSKVTTTTVEVRVIDDGPGIKPDALGKVFDRLYTTRSSPGRGVGTGLGLAIVRELAIAMGGTVFAEVGTSTGTQFVVNLPLISDRHPLRTQGPLQTQER